ncbi:MAG: hypothetical protein ACREPB_12485 [Arenimonas sp.]
MSTEAERTSISLQASLRRYLEKHPEAADSPEGIRQWWLTEELRMTPIGILRAALKALVASGEMQFSILPDGTELYARSVPSAVVSFKHQTKDDAD